MMGKNKKEADARAKVGTLIGPGAVFNGNLSAPDTVRIDGTVNGNCNCQGLLIVGVEGKINGDIISQNVIISGKVDGDIQANGKLELLSTGKLIGNITAKSLVVDEDACFDGRCTMTTSALEKSADVKNGKEKESKSNASGLSRTSNESADKEPADKEPKTVKTYKRNINA